MAIISLNNRQVFETNDDIIKYLKSNGSWLKTEQYLHNYPHCWRTDTPLIYKAVSSWYVKVSNIKERMVELNNGKTFLKTEFEDLNKNNTSIKKVISLETKRLIAKPMSIEYLEELASMYSDPEVRKYYYFSDEQIMSRDSSIANILYWQEYFKQHNLPRFILLDKKTLEFIGTAGICFYHPRYENFQEGKVEISYQLVKSAWNKGYATEIAKSLARYCFEHLPITEICACIVIDNIASQKVLDKCGFKLIKIEDNGYPKASLNKKYTSCYYELSKIDWLSQLESGINWIPNHLQEGQFGKWLENARDWSITRNRFWGCPVPVWKSTDKKYPRLDVYGSLTEIEKDFGIKIDNLHRPYIDNISRLNPSDPRSDINHHEHQDCSKMIRVTDVLDCWFESGSMPFAQMHYPFENKEKFEKNFPADFITEYLAQTRGWFYTLMVLSTALFNKAPFKNVICHGTILDEKSQKLSKRLKNYTDPLEIFSTIGSDAMRFYLISQPVMQGQELRIDKDGKVVKEMFRLAIKPLINSFNFFCLYANADKIKANRLYNSLNLENPLDKYILAKMKVAIKTIDENLAKYNTIEASHQFIGFFEILNNWYIRRNRHRFWRSIKEGNIDNDKQNAYNVLYTVLINICEAVAPILPFTAEFIWQSLNIDNN